MTRTTLIFILAAAAINVLTYGGIAWVYFADKRRTHARPTPAGADRPRAAAAQAEAAPGSRYRDAA